MEVRQRSRAGDVWLAHPTLDLLPVAFAALVLAWRQPGYQSLSDDMSAALYGGTATFAGLALAAATFACSTTYQSANVLLIRVRQANARLLRRNWTWIILTLLAAGATPLLSMVVHGASRPGATTATLVALLVIVLSAVRALCWLSYTLWMDVLEADLPARIPTPEAARTFGGR